MPREEQVEGSPLVWAEISPTCYVCGHWGIVEEIEGWFLYPGQDAGRLGPFLTARNTMVEAETLRSSLVSA